MSEESELVRLRRENDILRGIAAKIMPCHYCGVDSIVKCPHGFPGCALADDEMAADDCANRVVRELREELKELKVKYEKQSDPAKVQGSKG